MRTVRKRQAPPATPYGSPTAYRARYPCAPKPGTVIHKSMSLAHEPSSEPLHNSYVPVASVDPALFQAHKPYTQILSFSLNLAAEHTRPSSPYPPPFPPYSTPLYRRVDSEPLWGVGARGGEPHADRLHEVPNKP